MRGRSFHSLPILIFLAFSAQTGHRFRMGKRGRFLIAVAAIAVLAVLAWAVLRSPATAPEPVYNGKPLSHWLRGYGNFTSDTNSPTSGEADAAVREIGPDATPTLLLMLRAHDIPLKTKFLNWATRYRYFRVHYPNSGTINFEAWMGLRVLGPDAYGAVPELIHILDEKAPSNSVSFAMMILANIGPGAYAAVPSLLRLAADTNQLTRNSAIFALGRIHADPDAVVPVLINALHDPSAATQERAVASLGDFGGDARSAVPDLTAIIHEPDGGSNSVPTSPAPRIVRTAAEYALRQIDPENYPRVVTNSVQAPIPYR